MASVGVIANPASGRDIRRLVAGASVFGNAEKGAMVYRLLTGLAATGIERVLMLPAPDGVTTTLRRHLDAGSDGLPPLEELDIALDGTARDTTRAVEAMVDSDVAAIVVLGGDGTHRIVAKACGETPICAIATGTDNAFPELRETTVAGIATGLVATGRAAHALRREHALQVTVGDVVDLALVDVAVTDERFADARAIYDARGVSELFVAFASPSAVGLSAIAGALRRLPRGGGRGLHVRLGDGLRVRVAIAPGLVTDVDVASHHPLKLHDTATIAPGAGAIALDGERELERRAGEPATVRLVPGPLTIDIDAALARAQA